MPFVLPDFHLKCDIWTADANGIHQTVRISNLSCQMVYYFRQTVLIIKLPAKTDVRPRAAAPQVGYFGDVIECPRATANFFVVNAVSDVARGYTNEYRAAYCVRDPSQTTFPLQ